MTELYRPASPIATMHIPALKALMRWLLSPNGNNSARSISLD
jgi:hypothetical protein